LDFEEAQDFTIAAAGEPFAVLLIGAERGWFSVFLHFCFIILKEPEKAPGKGGATARTRSWISFALLDQSMPPSSGRRRP
jgi:hypothetical protein